MTAVVEVAIGAAILAGLIGAGLRALVDDYGWPKAVRELAIVLSITALLTIGVVLLAKGLGAK